MDPTCVCPSVPGARHGIFFVQSFTLPSEMLTLWVRVLEALLVGLRAVGLFDAHCNVAIGVCEIGLG